MTKIDEAVEAGLYAAHESVFESLPAMVAAFHRALRERGYVVVSQYLITTAREFLAAGDEAVTTDDDTAATLRFGETQARLRAMLEAVK